MAYVLLASAALLCPANANTKLPGLIYRYASFEVPNPLEAASFFAKYTGAKLMRSNEDFLIGDSGNATVVGCRVPSVNGYSDVYFQHDSSLPGCDHAMDFAARVAKTHSMANDDWDWWQDWHLAFYAIDGIDSIALRLLQDNVPFVSRGSLYFTIPTTGLIIQILGDPTVYWKEPFLFCRHTDDRITGQMTPYPLNVTDIASTPKLPISRLIPSHQSLAATNAIENAAWAYKFLNVTAFDTHTSPNDSHAYANGTCANIQWMYMASGFQIHFIQQFVKREGYVRVGEHEGFVNTLHQKLRRKDAYMNYRVGLAVENLAPYVENLKFHNEAYLLEAHDSRLRIAAPNGYIFEIFEDSATAAKSSMQLGTSRQW